MAKLYFRYSAMGAGKSLDLIKVAYNYEERGLKTVLFNSSLDTRFSQGSIASRTGIQKEAIPFSPEMDFYRTFVENFKKRDVLVSCLLVDEAQFLNKQQVAELRQLVVEFNVPIICYGLRTDFRGELFEGSQWLLAWADTIEELKTICWCGRKATMNARVINDQVIKHGEQIHIGGNEAYIALCQKHYCEGHVARGNHY